MSLDPQSNQIKTCAGDHSGNYQTMVMCIPCIPGREWKHERSFSIRYYSHLVRMQGSPYQDTKCSLKSSRRASCEQIFILPCCMTCHIEAQPKEMNGFAWICDIFSVLLCALETARTLKETTPPRYQVQPKWSAELLCLSEISQFMPFQRISTLPFNGGHEMDKSKITSSCSSHSVKVADWSKILAQVLALITVTTCKKHRHVASSS